MRKLRLTSLENSLMRVTDEGETASLTLAISYLRWIHGAERPEDHLYEMDLAFMRLWKFGIIEFTRRGFRHNIVLTEEEVRAFWPPSSTLRWDEDYCWQWQPEYDDDPIDYRLTAEGRERLHY